MQLQQAIILGFIQGLTEFLPVSSSGHLVLMQNFFGINEPEILFDIFLHLGTLVAICIVFFKEIFSILDTIRRLPGLLRSSNGWFQLFEENEDIRIAALMIIGSIPTAVLGLMLERWSDQLFGSVWLVGLMLLVTGCLLALTRKLQAEGRFLKQVTVKDSFLIGLIQGLAVIPGISRSGATISVALFLGIDREVAGRFSFLLSIPAILGALIVHLQSEVLHPVTSGLIIFSGTVTAGVVGFVALKVLLRLVRQGHLYFFSPYCWLAGMAALILGW